jgi:hypothetical protein
LRYIKNNLILGSSIIATLLLFSTFSVADPVLENVIIEPDEITVKSDVTVTASFDWDNITDVILYIEECSSIQQSCFITHSEKMSTINNSEFTATIPLTIDKTTYITYYFDVVADGQTYQLINLSSWTVNLNLDNDNTNQNGDEATNDDGTPGFEILIFFIAIISALIIYRKRLR